MNKQLTLILGAAATIVALVGCQHQPTVDGSTFPQEGTVRAPQRFAEVQAAAGARYDATLGSAHFNGESLSSLGYAKLDAMVADDDLPQPMTVYVNLPDSALAEARRAAVRAYLLDAGLRDEQIDLQTGTNPGTTHLASLQSSRLYEAGDTGLTNADTPTIDSAPSTPGFGIPRARGQ